jgi:aspartyl-tRNA(Asn)/glutamyl-tRNA(Gln) amidotransferase subunit A
MDIKLNFASIRELSCKMETGELSPISLVEDSFNQIKEYNPTFNAFITILEKAALREAETTEKRVKKGHYKGPLDGIPYSLKDIIYVKGVRCTAGSSILKHFFPKRNAECVSQLRRAGSIIVGTTNMNEFASGITGINPHYGSSINPWNKDHISGGSSGGSCVSVSCGMVPFSLGTDTGGSIRVPSAYCGVVGMKPTYDLISRDGIINLAPSLDNIGCITRSCLGCSTGTKKFDTKGSSFPLSKDLKFRRRYI